MFGPRGSNPVDCRARRLNVRWDLAMRLPRVDWNKAYWNLPLEDIIKSVGGPKGVYADAMPVCLSRQAAE